MERPLGVLVAVEQEFNPLLKLAPLTPHRVEGVCIWSGLIHGRPVVIAKSGMGRVRAGHAAAVLSRETGLGAMLIGGYAGGLKDDLRPGDLVLADGVILGSPNNHREWLPSHNEIASQVLSGTGTASHVGRLLTLDKVVGLAKRKRDVARSHPLAIALDMESAGAVEVCESNDVPWTVVRAVSDGLNDDLPFAFDRFTSDESGEVSRSRVAVAAMIQPWKIPALIRLDRRSALAARNLAAFVEAYIIALQPNSNETAAE